MSAPCDRCGIDVPAHGMLCTDCLDVLELPHDELRTYTDGLIRMLNAKQYSDAQIARIVGLSSRTVNRRRKALSIPGIVKASRDFWTDPQTALENNRRGIDAYNAKRWAA